MTNPYTDPMMETYQSKRIVERNALAEKLRGWRGWGGYYHKRLAKVYSHMIPVGATVLEIGCNTGDLLASLKPARGIGVEIAPQMVALAQERHPELTFICAAEDQFQLDGEVDFIILSDILNEAWDVQAIFMRIQQVTAPGARVIINTYNRLWEFPLWIAEKINVAKPSIGKNWLLVSDLCGLLQLSGFETIKTSQEVLFPFGIPLLEQIFNSFLVRLWPFRHFAMSNFVIARKLPQPQQADAKPMVSVIVPARNERGNIENILSRTPEMGSGTEIVFVEGHSSDDTYAAIEAAISRHPERRIQLMRQGGKGKGDAVRMGFAAASGDVLMILDADLTVPPEDLPRFYDALTSGKADFVNGVRLVYPMEEEAMRFFNLIGNKFFSLAFSWLLGQPVKDTLCGTKVLWKKDYMRIAANRSYFGEFDPFGDFDLLFGASVLNYKIIDLPIRYRARSYGSTNIERWKHGWVLLRMVMFAARKIKFV